jgi:hypothetical protein
MTVISEGQVQPITLVLSIDPMPGNVSRHGRARSITTRQPET